jgi:hypothetical protein
LKKIQIVYKGVKMEDLKEKVQEMLDGNYCDDARIDPKEGVLIFVGTTVKAYGDSYGTWEKWEYDPTTKKISGCYGDYISRHGYSTKSPPSYFRDISSSYLGEDFRKITKGLGTLNLPIKMSVNIWHD